MQESYCNTITRNLIPNGLFISGLQHSARAIDSLRQTDRVSKMPKVQRAGASDEAGRRMHTSL